MKSLAFLLILFLWYGTVSSNNTRMEIKMRNDSKQKIGDLREIKIKEQVLDVRDDEECANSACGKTCREFYHS